MLRRRDVVSLRFPATGTLRAAPSALAVFLGLTVLAFTDTSVSIEDYAEAPPPTSLTEGYNEQRNVYFGDVHIHTRYSFDAYLLGTEVTPDQSYRFAKGEAIESSFGNEMKLKEPLDFFAVSDHGFFLGLVPQWADPSTRVGQVPGAEAFHGVNDGDNRHPYSAQMRAVLFRQSFGRQMRTEGGFMRCQRARMANHPSMQYASFDDDAHRSAWEDSILAAERHNDPGNFTTFIAYEWTSSTPAPESAAYHRNVIFASSKAPARPFTRIDFIGSSDTHNGAPSFDESNYFGSAPTSVTPENRGTVPVSQERLDYIAGLPPAARARGAGAGRYPSGDGPWWAVRGSNPRPLD